MLEKILMNIENLYEVEKKNILYNSITHQYPLECIVCIIKTYQQLVKL